MQTFKVDVYHNVAVVDRHTHLARPGVYADEYDDWTFDEYPSWSAYFGRPAPHMPGDPLRRICQVEVRADSITLDTYGTDDLTWVAHRTWELCQNDNPRGPAPAYLRAKVRSLCVGDVVVIGEVAFAADAVGWVPTSFSRDDIAPNRVRL